MSGSFYFDSRQFSGSEVTVRMRTNAMDHRATMYVSCPGGSVPAVRQDVTFNYRETSNWYSCSAEVAFNGGSSYELEEGRNTLVSLPPGANKFSITQTCFCDDTYCSSPSKTQLSISGGQGSSVRIDEIGDYGAIFVGYDGKVRELE